MDVITAQHVSIMQMSSIYITTKPNAVVQLRDTSSPTQLTATSAGSLKSKPTQEFLCRMCKSYFYTGLGFNIQTGGLSNVAPINGLQKRYVSVPLSLCGLSLPTDPRLFSLYLSIC
jgi:hypothetical protein